MIEHTPYDEARSRPTTALQMPQQAPPVDRAEAAPAAAPGDTSGLEASRFVKPIWESFLPEM
ncbi:hypothetical protein ACF08B_40770 [Streptomyces sp. NPDC015139]|uniref:hypothetical protein n=1 Tax=Streptomyces sp. NPDC015139 TaxID=3364942 RepID=UPI0037021DF9